MSNPYARALALRGLTSGGSMPWLTNPYMKSLYGSNPLLRSPWLDSPWASGALTDSLWGVPDWGARPMDTYNYYDYMGLSPAWSSDDLAGWVDEPWETSSWNPDAKDEKSTAKARHDDRRNSDRSANQMPPLVQNFNYSVAPQIQPDDNRSPDGVAHEKRSPGPGSNRQHRSPLAKLSPAESPGYRRGYRPDAGQYQSRNSAPDSRPDLRPGQRPGQQPDQRLDRPPGAAHPKVTRKPETPPCVTPFCGLKKPYLDGLWMAPDGEMLGIRNQRYLWSDGDSRYLTGQMKVQNEYLLANVDGHNTLMRFKYKLANGRLLTLQPDGTMREFVRIPTNQVRGY